MPVPRRNFMQLFGISLGSLILARCQRTGTPSPTPVIITCYEAPPYTPTPTPPTPTRIAALDRLRLCWLRFGELADQTREMAEKGDPAWEDYALPQQMITDHNRALVELVSLERITIPVSALIQEAYSAAVYHIWRSNVPMTCYEPVIVDYAPAGAANLVRQSEVLADVAAGTTIAPDTITKAQAALEHDLAFYALTDEEVQALYERLLEEYRNSGEPIPSFEELELTLTPDVIAAAQFLLDVLMGK